MTRPSSPNRPAAGARSLRGQTPLYDLVASTAAAFWPLDDAAGSLTAREVVGTAGVGTPAGGCMLGTGSGLEGKAAASFDGTSGAQIAVPSNALFNPAGGWTWECWFQSQRSYTKNVCTLIVSRASQFGLGLFSDPFLYPADVGTPIGGGTGFVLRPNSEWSGAGPDAGHRITLNTAQLSGPWHHFVQRYNAATGETAAFIDGIKAGNTIAAGIVLLSATSSVLFGGVTYTVPAGFVGTLFNSGKRNFQGQLAYVAYYTTGLTDAQILQRWGLGSSATGRGLGGLLTYASQILLNPGLLRYFPLTESSGTTAYEQAAGKHGLHSGATPGVSGQIGTATSYDGVSGRTDINEASNLPAGLTALSVEGWVNPSSTDGAESAIIGLGDQANQKLVYRIGKTAGTAQLSVIVQLDATLYQYNTTAALLQANTWQHVGVTLQNGQAPMVVLNGAQRNLDSGATLGTALLQTAPTNTAHRIGASENGGQYPFAGAIQHVATYTAALGVADYLTRYQSGSLVQARPPA